MADSPATTKKEQNLIELKETAKQQIPTSKEMGNIKKENTGLFGTSTATQVVSDSTVVNNSSPNSTVVNNLPRTTKVNKNAVLRRSKSAITMQKEKTDATLPHSLSFSEKTQTSLTRSQWSIPENYEEIAKQTDHKVGNNYEVTMAKDNSNKSINDGFKEKNKAELTGYTSVAIPVKTTECLTIQTTKLKPSKSITILTTKSNPGECMNTPTTISKISEDITTTETTCKPAECITRATTISKSSECIAQQTTITKPAECFPTPTTSLRSVNYNVTQIRDDCISPPKIMYKKDICIRTSSKQTQLTSKYISTSITTICSAVSSKTVTTPSKEKSLQQYSSDTSNNKRSEESYQNCTSLTLQELQTKQEAKLGLEVVMSDDYQLSTRKNLFHLTQFSPFSICCYSESLKKRWIDKCNNIERFHGDTLSSTEESDEDFEPNTSSSVIAVSQDATKICYRENSRSGSSEVSSFSVADSNYQVKAISTTQSSTLTSTFSTRSSKTVTLPSHKPSCPPSISKLPSSLFSTPLQSSLSSPPYITLSFASSSLSSLSSISSSPSLPSPSALSPITTTTTVSSVRSKTDVGKALQISITGSADQQPNREDSLEVDHLSPTELLLTNSSSNSSELSSISSSGTSEQSTMSSIDSRLTATIQPFCRSESQVARRKDIVLLNAEADTELAETCRDHLLTDIGEQINNFTADLFSEIDSGRTSMRSLEQLHDKYIFIFILCTPNLKEDNFAMFLQENILAKGLKDGNGKEDRVIPIWANSNCKNLILELSTLKGFNYYNFLSEPTSKSAKSYIEFVKKTVIKGREKYK